MPTAQPDPSRRNRESSRKALVAAMELTEQLGWAKVSIEGIAARAGIGKQTIYRWWPSKGMLLLEGFVQHVEDLFYAHLEATPPTDDFAADMRLMLRVAFVDTLAPYKQVYAAIIGEAQHDPELAASLRERLLTPAADQIADRVRLAQERGHVAQGVDPHQAIGLLVGQIYYHWLLLGNAPDRAFLDDCVNLAMQGLRPRSGAH